MTDIIITDTEIEMITQQLGREPVGMKEILIRNKLGHPVVIRVGAINNGKPFPNMYWLSDRKICKEIDHIESRGFVKELENNIIPNNPDLIQSLVEDHKKYIAKRWKYFEQEYELDSIEEVYKQALKEKGIGGLMKFDRVRCLHMHYAHYLVDGNSIGQLIEEKFHLKQHIL